jgi:hypothetical protein
MRGKRWKQKSTTLRVLSEKAEETKKGEEREKERERERGRERGN